MGEGIKKEKSEETTAKKMSKKIKLVTDQHQTIILLTLKVQLIDIKTKVPYILDKYKNTHN